jgi:resolvase-like protein
MGRLNDLPGGYSQVQAATSAGVVESKFSLPEGRHFRALGGKVKMTFFEVVGRNRFPREEDKSSTTSCNTPTRRFDAVLVWKLDRWGRSVADRIRSLQELVSPGVRFLAVTSEMICERSGRPTRRQGQREGPGGSWGAPGAWRRDEAVRLRSQGVSWRKIAQLLAEPMSTVTGLVRKASTPLGPRGETRQIRLTTRPFPKTSVFRAALHGPIRCSRKSPVPFLGRQSYNRAGRAYTCGHPGYQNGNSRRMLCSIGGGHASKKGHVGLGRGLVVFRWKR